MKICLFLVTVFLANAALISGRYNPNLLWGSNVDFADPKVFVRFVSSSQGNDNSLGNITHPFRTLQRALTVANTGVALNMKSYVVLRQGVFSLTSTIVITAQRNKDCPLTIMAFPSENVTITAALPIQTSQWKPAKRGSGINAAVDATKLRLLDVRVLEY